MFEITKIIKTIEITITVIIIRNGAQQRWCGVGWDFSGKGAKNLGRKP